MRPRIRAAEWAQFDMHHLLWEPALGARRFFELYCETWRRSVLNLGGRKKWWQWLRDVRLQDAVFLARMLRRTQHLMDPEFYLSEHRLVGPGVWGLGSGARAAAIVCRRARGDSDCYRLLTRSDQFQRRHR
jgi:hypothetical protein